jgi:hypothetical protein
MNFHADNLSLHENGMRITALNGEKVLYSQTYYSIGGGFIVDEAHFGQSNDAPVAVPYPYKSAADLQRTAAKADSPFRPDDAKRAGAAQQGRAGSASFRRLGSDAQRN